MYTVEATKHTFDRGMQSWRKRITEVMTEVGDSWNNLVYSTLSDEDLNVSFQGNEAKAFKLWTTDRVYYPFAFCGAAWVGSVLRNPRDEGLLDYLGQEYESDRKSTRLNSSHLGISY